MDAGSLVGDFNQALKDVQQQFHPDRILIEPSGVGKLSDVTRAVVGVAEQEPEMVLGSAITVADATKCKVYMKNFGEFYNNQVESAGTIVLSRTQKVSEEKLAEAVALLKEKNPKATVITTPWDALDGKQILAAMEERNDLAAEMMEELRHEHHHDHGEECTCGCHDHDHEHHHDHDHDEHEHHHEHDHEHEHEHHHDHDEACTCGCHDHEHHHDHDHDHHHHHGHHADEVFTSWGVETPKTFTEEAIHSALEALDTGDYGAVLRAKGIVPCGDGTWLHFDFVPGDLEIRHGGADVTGRLCVIGSQLKEEGLKELFRV